jgi:hypothetical protein
MVVAGLIAVIAATMQSVRPADSATRDERANALFAQTVVVDHLFTQGQMPLAAIVVTPDAPVVSPQAERTGPAGVQSLISEFARAMETPRFAIERVVPNADRVTIYWSWSGALHAPLFGIEPSDEPVTLQGTFVMRIHEEKVHELRVGGGAIV